MKQASDHKQYIMPNIEDNLVSKEKIDFIYENGINTLKDIDNGNKVINTRATMLMVYLASIIAFAFQYFLRSGFIDINWSHVVSLAISFEYSAVMYFVVTKILYPSFAYPTYNEPQSFLSAEVLRYDISLIKKAECENIQNRINHNLQRHCKKGKALKWILIATFAIPLVTLLVALFLWLVGGVLMNHCCL